MFVRETIAAIETFGLTVADRTRLYEGNARALFKLPPA